MQLTLCWQLCPPTSQLTSRAYTVVQGGELRIGWRPTSARLHMRGVAHIEMAPIERTTLLQNEPSASAEPALPNGARRFQNEPIVRARCSPDRHSARLRNEPDLSTEQALDKQSSVFQNEPNRSASATFDDQTGNLRIEPNPEIGHMLATRTTNLQNQPNPDSKRPISYQTKNPIRRRVRQDWWIMELRGNPAVVSCKADNLKCPRKVVHD